MQGPSWKAALTVVLTLATVGALASPTIAGEPTKRKVVLSLKFDGLSADGGEVEIKPGNAACKFETIKFQTKGHPRKNIYGEIVLDPIEVETQSADRDCSFAITLKEAGRPDKTVRRILKLTAATDAKAATPQTLTCFISSANMQVGSKSSEKTGETTRKN